MKRGAGGDVSRVRAPCGRCCQAPLGGADRELGDVDQLRGAEAVALREVASRSQAYVTTNFIQHRSER